MGKKKIISIVAIISVLVLSLSFFLVKGFVKADNYSFDELVEVESTSDLENEFNITKQDDQTTIKGLSNTITIDNKSQVTELKLKNINAIDFAMTFDFKVLSGEGILSVLYNLGENKGHELRINTKQYDDANAYSYYGLYEDGVEQGKNGRGLEAREIRNSSINDFDSMLMMFNYYEIFEYGKSYTVELIQKDGITKFYIDNILFLDVPYTNDLSSNNFAFRISDLVKIEIKNIRILDIPKYFNEKIESFDTDLLLTKDEKIDFKNYFSKFEKTMNSLISENEIKELTNYNHFLLIKNNLVKMFAPVISLTSLSATEYNVGTKIALPKATAISFYDEKVVVRVEVEYNNKFLQINDNEVSLNEAGKYIIRYSAFDSDGNKGIKEVTVYVK